jgi:hypothetical protein
MDLLDTFVEVSILLVLTGRTQHWHNKKEEWGLQCSVF